MKYVRILFGIYKKFCDNYLLYFLKISCYNKNNNNSISLLIKNYFSGGLKMTENMVVGIFNVESEGYQAMTELKQTPASEGLLISQAVLAKKEDGEIKVLDSFDTGAFTLDDTMAGGLAGALIGILGGPIGMLLGGAYGALLGSVMDTGDAIDQASMIEQIAGKMMDGELVIVALAAEENEEILNSQLSKFDSTIMRYDAAVVAQEVADAREMEAEMARQARAELRKEKNDEFKNKVEEHKEKIKDHFAQLKEKKA